MAATTAAWAAALLFSWHAAAGSEGAGCQVVRDGEHCASGEEAKLHLLLGVPDDKRHPAPTRGIDFNRSAYSPKFKATFPLAATPSWEYEVKGLNRHQTPAIDDQRNVYVGSDAGILQSLDKIGRVRWSVQAGKASAQNPALRGDVVFSSTKEGYAIAIHKDTGRVIWRKRVSHRDLGGDTYSPTAFDDFLIIPGYEVPPYGSPEIICINIADGSIRWVYDVGKKYGGTIGEMAKNGIGPKYTTVNLTPCYWNGSLIFNDVSGAMFRIAVADGREIWYVPGDDKDMYTLGGSCCGPNGKAYLGFSTGPNQGALQVLDLHTGKKLWRASYPMEVHSAPAVGYINGRLSAVVGVGSPPGLPDIFSLFVPDWVYRRWNRAGRPLAQKVQTVGHVYALDAETGEQVWNFTPPVWTEKRCAGSTFDQMCLPDLWSGPTIDAAGTTWINWSAGGHLYGLRDANGDGVVALDDKAEMTFYDMETGVTGPPAVADNMVFTAACRKLVAFVE